jgi:transcriptional regulator with XRE-family HTH domain
LNLDMTKKKPPLKHLGDRIRDLRREQGIPVRQLAGFLGIDESRLRKWEAGEHQPPLASLVQLSELLGDPIENLLGLNNPAPPLRDQILLARFRSVAQLPLPEQQAVITALDVLLAYRALIEGRVSRLKAASEPGAETNGVDRRKTHGAP